MGNLKQKLRKQKTKILKTEWNKPVNKYIMMIAKVGGGSMKEGNRLMVKRHHWIKKDVANRERQSKGDSISQILASCISETLVQSIPFTRPTRIIRNYRVLAVFARWVLYLGFRIQKDRVLRLLGNLDFSIIFTVSWSTIMSQKPP